MPVPSEYQRATEIFYGFLHDVRDTAGFGSTHQAYTMVQGVLQTFRRRLNFRQAILFAGVLPPVLRAIFVSDWNVDEPLRSFEDRNSMTAEVRSLRPGHNFSTDNAISVVAAALRRNIDVEKFDRVLFELPEGSKQFWEA